MDLVSKTSNLTSNDGDAKGKQDQSSTTSDTNVKNLNLITQKSVSTPEIKNECD